MVKKIGSVKRGTEMTEKVVRHLFLLIVTIIFFIGYVFTEKYDVILTGKDYDTCLYVYGANVLVTAICAILYSMEWYRRKEATEVYAFITLLFYAMTFDYATQFIVRYMVGVKDCYGNVVFFFPLNAWWWEMRGVPRLIVCFYMLILVIGRMVERRRR